MRAVKMRRVSWSAFLSVVVALILASPVGAGFGWCRADPIVNLNGTRVNILVAIPKQYRKEVEGPILTVLNLPRGVAGDLLFTDEGFNGHGEEVRFFNRLDAEEGDRFSIQVYVRVPLPEAVPMQVTVKPANARNARVFKGSTDGLLIETTIVGADGFDDGDGGDKKDDDDEEDDG